MKTSKYLSQYSARIAREFGWICAAQMRAASRMRSGYGCASTSLMG